MPTLRHYVHGTSESAMYDDEDLWDDSTGAIPILGSKTPIRLRDRFLSRLSKMAGATAKLTERENQDCVFIRLARNPGSPHCRIEFDNELQQMLECMKQSLSTISMNCSGSQCREAQEDLWDSILIYSYSNVDHVVQSIRRAFADNKEIFDKFLTRWFGIDDEMGSQVDYELAEYLISLHQKIHSYDKSLGQLHTLIHFAADLARDVLHLQIRMRCLIRKGKFANELYHLICTLGFPQRAYTTFVRAAQTSPAFAHISFHLEPNALTPTRVHFANSNPNTTAKAAISLVNPMSMTSIARKDTSTGDFSTVRSNNTINVVPRTPPQTRAPEPPKVPEGKQQPVSSAHQRLVPSQKKYIPMFVRPSLAQGDISCNLPHIQPASKRDTEQLISTVLRGNLLPISANSWYIFGFVTTKADEEERHLGGLYAALLKDAHDPASILHELTTAVETNTLVEFFDSKDYGHFRGLFPHLEAFLNTPPTKRSTVWRLKQFVHDDINTEPPPCLKRDFGFKFCKQREEVHFLKSIYARVLNKVKPRELHEACVCGALYQFVVQQGIYVDLKHKRLMQNDSPAPSVGFDNDEGLAAYSGRLFKKPQKL